MKTTLILLLVLSCGPARAAKPAPLPAGDAVVQIKLKDLLPILLPRTSDALPADLKALLAEIATRLAAIELLLKAMVQPPPSLLPTPLPPALPPPAVELGAP